MKETWLLDVLYKGYDDPQFEADIKKLDELIAQCNTLADTLSHKDETATLKQILTTLNELEQISYQLLAYANLRQSCDTTDAQTAAYLDKITKKTSNVAKAKAKFNRYIAQIKDLDACLEKEEALQEYTYLLHSIQEDGRYLLSDDVEEVLSKMDISAGQAWETMQSYLTSTLEVDYDGKTTTLSQIRNLAYDSDKKVRKRAYEAELAAYAKIRDAIAFSLNNIKAQVLTECELRGFATP